MARMVTVTITYDMDDTAKSLEAERQDWINGHVNVQDILTSYGEDDPAGTITITED